MMTGGGLALTETGIGLQYPQQCPTVRSRQLVAPLPLAATPPRRRAAGRFTRSPRRRGQAAAQARRCLVPLLSPD
jgi:hypothetical protein